MDTPAMDPNSFDITGIPTTLTIIAVCVMIVLALRHFNKKFPQVRSTIVDATPWMGWEDTEPVDVGQIPVPASAYHDYPRR